MLEMHLA